MKSNHFIRGLGFYAPEKVLTNADLETLVDTSDEWITTRTGIKERHIIAPGQTCSDMALEASKKALADAKMEPDELTHIILATFTADTPIPSGSCILQDKLGLKGKMAIDVSAACSGFVYSMELARGIIALHPEAKILVVASEALTQRVNWTDRATCVLFGDGAAAAIVTGNREADTDGKILDMITESDGSIGDLLTVRGGGSAYHYGAGDVIGDVHFVQMQGREVYKHAVRNMTRVGKEVVKRNGFKMEDVDVLLPHQANLRIIEAVGDRLKIPTEKVFVNVDKFGNTSGAAVPIALADARGQRFIKDGDLVLVITFGGGFTWGSALVQF